MTPFEELIKNTLADLQAQRLKATSVTLAARLPTSDRNIRHYLSRMKRAGVVYQPGNHKSGWLVA